MDSKVLVEKGTLVMTIKLTNVSFLFNLDFILFFVIFILLNVLVFSFVSVTEKHFLYFSWLVQILNYTKR